MNISSQRNSVRIAALLIALLLLLSGCSGDEQGQGVSVPIYELSATQYVRATLHFPSSVDYQSGYSTEEDRIEIPTGSTMEWMVVDQLRAGPRGDYERMLPALATGVDEVYVIGDVLYINISYDMEAVVDDSFIVPSDIIRFRTAAMLTLSPLTGAQYCVMRVNDRLFSGIPIGVATATMEGRNADFNALLNPNNSYSRNVLLYYVANESSLCVPQVKQMNASHDVRSFLDAMVERLTQDPQQQGLSALFEQDVDYQSHSIGGEGNERVLTLRLSGGVAVGELPYACLAMSVLHNLPDISAVRIFHNNTAMQFSDENGDKQELFRIEQLAHMLGGYCTLYFTDRSGASLIGIERVLGHDLAHSKFGIVSTILGGPVAGEANEAFPIVPSGVGPEDLLSARLYNNVLALDFSRNFYERGASLSADSERALLYAIVNACTQKDGVTGVLFLREGEPVERLSSEGGINLHQPLYRNPGLIVN